MRNLFAVPWLTLGRRTLLSMGLAVLVVVSIFALLKIGSGGKHAPEKELLTGSNQKVPVRTSPSKTRWLPPRSGSIGTCPAAGAKHGDGSSACSVAAAAAEPVVKRLAGPL